MRSWIQSKIIRNNLTIYFIRSYRFNLRILVFEAIRTDNKSIILTKNMLTKFHPIERLYEEIRKKHKYVFWKNKIGQKRYSSTYAQLVGSSKNYPIHLIIIEDDKDATQIAYSIESNGFPIITNVQPKFQFVSPLEHLRYERQGSKVIQIFVTKQAKPYKEIELSTNDMADVWMTAINNFKSKGRIKKENPENFIRKQHLEVKLENSTLKQPSKPKKQAPQYLRQLQEMQMKEKQSVKKLDQLKLNCNELEKQNEQYKRTNKQKTKENKALQQQVTSLQAQKSLLEEQINYLSNLIAKNDSLQKVSKKTDDYIQVSLAEELISFKQKSMKLDRQLKLKSEENSIMNNKINTLEQQIQSLKETQKEFQHIKEQMLEDIKKTEQKLSQEARDNEQLTIQRDNLSNQLDIIQLQVKQTQKKCSQLQLSITQKEKEFQQEMAQLKKQVQETRNNTKEANKDKQRIQELQKAIQQAKKAQECLRKEVQHFKQQNDLMKNEPKQLEEEKTKLHGLEQKITHLQYQQYFQGTILADQHDHKMFLISALQEFKQCKIVKTNRIFTFDPLNKTSFHKYIDEVPDLVILIKTQKGYFLAGFSESPLSSTHSASKGGLIFSLTNRKSYSLIEGKRSITYDTYFLIVGNSEIRWREHETKCFCNFGIPNGYYDSKGDKVNDLLGEGTEREVPVTAVEVHKVTFEE